MLCTNAISSAPLTFVMDYDLIVAMKDIQKIRLANLHKLLNERFDGVQAKFASAIEKDKNQVRFLLYPEKAGGRTLGERQAREIESKVGLKTGWFDQCHDGESINVEEVRYKVPIISWVRAGEFCESPDLYEPGVAEETFPCNYKPGRHTYALRVVGDSMEPKFPEGCVLIVEPDATMDNGSFVIAKYDGQVTFKRAVLDGTQWWLRPLNTAYESIKMTEDTHICGVVKKFYYEGDV